MYGMSCEILHFDSILILHFIRSFVLIDEKNYTYHTYYTLLYIINKININTLKLKRQKFYHLLVTTVNLECMIKSKIELCRTRH